MRILLLSILILSSSAHAQEKCVSLFARIQNASQIETSFNHLNLPIPKFAKLKRMSVQELERNDFNQFLINYNDLIKLIPDVGSVKNLIGVKSENQTYVLMRMRIYDGKSIIYYSKSLLDYKLQNHKRVEISDLARFDLQLVEEFESRSTQLKTEDFSINLGKENTNLDLKLMYRAEHELSRLYVEFANHKENEVYIHWSETNNSARNNNLFSKLFSYLQLQYKSIRTVKAQLVGSNGDHIYQSVVQNMEKHPLFVKLSKVDESAEKNFRDSCSKIKAEDYYEVMQQALKSSPIYKVLSSYGYKLRVEVHPTSTGYIEIRMTAER